MTKASSELMLVGLSRDDLGPEQVMPPSPAKWLAEHTCRCNSVKEEHHNKPLDIHFTRHPRHGFASAFGAAVVRKQIIEIAMRHDPMFRPQIGRVLNRKGEVSDSLCSVHEPSSKGISLRSGRGAKYRVCCDCGFTFLDMPGKPAECVLVDAYVEGRCSLVLGGRLSLVMPIAAIDEIEALNEKSVECVPLTMTQLPPDGYRLPADPDWTKVSKSFEADRHNDWKSRWSW